MSRWDSFANNNGLNRTELIKRAVDQFMESKASNTGVDRFDELEAKLTAKIDSLDTKIDIRFIDFGGIMKDVFASGLISAGLIAKQIGASGHILHVSDNWSVDEADVKSCVSAWDARAKSVTFQRVKYSVLLCTPEYFTAINRATKAWLVGVSSPEGLAGRYIVLGYVPPGTDDIKDAYADLAKVASRMMERVPRTAESTRFKKYSRAEMATWHHHDKVFNDAAPGDPMTRNAITDFIEWVHADDGLDALVAHYFRTKDRAMPVLARLARAFKELKKDIDLGRKCSEGKVDDVPPLVIKEQEEGANAENENQPH